MQPDARTPCPAGRTAHRHHAALQRDRAGNAGGGVEVAAINPVESMRRFSSRDLAEVTETVREKLLSAINAVQ